MKFIITTNENTKNELLKMGFKIVGSNIGTYTFMNNQKIVFDKDKLKDVSYSNILHM